jgi:hypothetical protein
MCCEATDALLEYVRRYLGLTGLRNLNAPRRLKLRVPVLKEWLQRQGQHALAASIPDWDPVRRPTGSWKAWEVAHLKPIMDEKAVERQAKRSLVTGETNLARQMSAQAAEDNRREAIDALMAVAGPPSAGHKESEEIVIAPHHVKPADSPEAADAGAIMHEEYAVMIIDDAAEAAEQAAADAESSQADDNIASSAEGAPPTRCAVFAPNMQLLPPAVGLPAVIRATAWGRNACVLLGPRRRSASSPRPSTWLSASRERHPPTHPHTHTTRARAEAPPRATHALCAGRQPSAAPSRASRRCAICCCASSRTRSCRRRRCTMRSRPSTTSRAN